MKNRERKNINSELTWYFIVPIIVIIIFGYEGYSSGYERAVERATEATSID